MFRVVLAGLRADKARSLLIMFAIALGVGFFGGSIIYGDSARAAFFDDLARGAAGVDLVATPVGKAKPADQRPLHAVEAVPGVAHVDGRIITQLGLLDRRARVITNVNEVGLAVSRASWPGISPYRVTSGRDPAGAGDAALDAPTAAREGVDLGDRVTVLDRAGQSHDLTVVGLVDFGVSATFTDRSVVVLTVADLHALTDAQGYAEIVVAAEPNADLAALRQRVSAALGPGYTVTSGDDLRHQIAVEAAKYVDSFVTTLRITAFVALAVAFLVVFNTFQIVVAQRSREHALLRCVGASRRQIVGLVAVESLVVGLLASLAGVLLSVLVGYGLLVGRDTFGHALPDYHLVVSPLAVTAPVVVGIVFTVASALAPALTASRVCALAALTSSANPMPPARRTRLRYVMTFLAALALAGAGFALLNSGRGQGFDGLVAMVGGAMTVFGAVVFLMPLLVTTLSGPLRWMLGSLFGATGRVAMGNARRHPIRFAVAASALMVGIAPLTAFAVLLTTARVQGERELAENFPVDFVVSHAGVGKARPALSAALVERVRATPEFGVVALSRVADTGANGCCRRVGAAEPGVLGGKLAVEVRQGNLGGLAPGTAAVTTAFAGERGVGVGDAITVGPAGGSWVATIVATFDDTPIPAEVIVNWSDLATHLTGNDYLLIRRADAISAARAAAALDDALADDPLAIVSSDAQRRESVADSLERRLTQFNVLLGLSLAIAVLGIANTLSLSVLERTRESAILRALGLTRRQLVGMLLLEATLMALVGAAIGVALGIGFGWITARELIATYGHGSPAIPIRAIALYVGLAVVAGAIASILPARRAARSCVVSAMTDTT